VEDFLTVQIKPIFHTMDMSAHTAPRAMIPKPREVSLGINAGIKATAYTAAFALVRLVIRPNLKDAQADVFSVLCRSNFPNSFLSERNVCAEIKLKNITQDHLRIR